MTRGNWFITNVIGKICQNLFVKLDRDFPFATLKSVCVEDELNMAWLCLPSASTFVHKPLAAGWVPSSHLLRSSRVLFLVKINL